MKKINLLFMTFLGLFILLSCTNEEYLDTNDDTTNLQEKVYQRSSNSYTLTAHHVSVSEGSWEETPLSKINTKDQHGYNDSWSKYIELTPGNRRFRGYFSFFLPDDVNKADVEKIIVKTNYKGERSNVQKWYWKIKDYHANHWDYLGNNSFAQNWRWSSKSWTKTSNKYIRSSDKRILIKLYSNNDEEVCDIDYLVVEVKIASNNSGDWYKPTPLTTFDWILGEDNLPSASSLDADVIDIDAFDSSSSYVSQLHNNGKKAIAYISVGSYENWRSDADRFPNSVKGNNYDGWAGEKYLDIRQIEVLRPIMHDRFVMAKNKGFDAIEPDNIDLHTYSSSELGFHISSQDVINYCQMLSEEAHGLGLSIGQKNAADLSDDLVDVFDWALLEGVFNEGIDDNDASVYTDAHVYINNNKAVFATEYTDEVSSSRFQNSVCPKASNLHYTAILKDRDLTAPTETCN